MIGEPSAVTERRDTCAVPKSQQFPLSKPIYMSDILCSWDHRSYPLACKRKENARVKSTVRWRLIDFVEAVRDYVAINALRISTPSYNQSEVATAIQNKNVRSPVKHPATEG